MFKRLMALTLVLLFAAGAALAESTPQYDGLLDKLIHQLKQSAMRGILRLTVEGDSDLAMQLRPLSGAMIQFRSMLDNNEPQTDHRSEMILYAEKDGVRTADTRLWSDGQDLYASSELLIDTVLRYPWKGDFFSSLTAVGQSNPNYLTAVAEALINGRDWEKDAAPLRTHVENWLMTYSRQPQRVTEDGVSLLRFEYEIPEQDLKNEMKALLRLALSDETIYNRVRFYLTEQQRQTAFSAANLVYEDWIIDSFPLGGSLRILRDVNSMGELQRLRMVCPLGEQMAFTWEQEAGTDTCTLQAGDTQYSLSVRQTRMLKDTQAWEGTFTFPQDGKQVRGNYALSRTYSEMSDTEFVDHEYPNWTLDIVPAEDSDEDFEPVNISVRAHYYSKYDQLSSTTLEFETIYTQGTTKLNLRGKIISVTRWTVDDMDVTGALDVLLMTPEERNEIFADYLTNALVTLSFIGEEPPEEPLPAASEEAPQESAEAPEPEPMPDGAESMEEALPALVLVDSIDLDESEEDVG